MERPSDKPATDKWPNFSSPHRLSPLYALTRLQGINVVEHMGRANAYGQITCKPNDKRAVTADIWDPQQDDSTKHKTVEDGMTVMLCAV